MQAVAILCLLGTFGSGLAAFVVWWIGQTHPAPSQTLIVPAFIVLVIATPCLFVVALATAVLSLFV